MKRLIAVIALLSCAGGAGAEGINLSWNDCGVAGQSSRSFACDTNDGEDVLVGSIQLPAWIDTVCAFNAYLDMSSASPTLPSWWDVRSPFDIVPSFPPECRDTFGVSVVFDPMGLSCPPVFASMGVGFLASPTSGGPNRLHITLSVLRSAVPLQPAPEHYLFSILVRHGLTVGPGACAGCEIPMCIVFNELEIGYGVRCDSYRVSEPLERSHVSWQAASVEGCPLSTPVRRSTWGQIRSLYR